VIGVKTGIEEHHALALRGCRRGGRAAGWTGADHGNVEAHHTIGQVTLLEAQVSVVSSVGAGHKSVGRADVGGRASYADGAADVPAIGTGEVMSGVALRAACSSESAFARGSA
jgi:hypothetical protein